MKQNALIKSLPTFRINQIRRWIKNPLINLVCPFDSINFSRDKDRMVITTCSNKKLFCLCQKLFCKHAGFELDDSFDFKSSFPTEEMCPTKQLGIEAVTKKFKTLLKGVESA